MLEIKVIGDEVYVYSSDWHNLELDEKFFFRDLRASCVRFVETNKKGFMRLDKLVKIPYHMRGKEERQWARLVFRTLKKACDDRNIPYGEDFLKLYEQAKDGALVAEKYAGKQRLKDEYMGGLEKAIVDANTVMRKGCGWCQFLRTRGTRPYCIAAQRFCRKKADEEEVEFYARREAKVTGLDVEFYAQPYPCMDCPIVEQGQRAMERRSEILDRNYRN